MPNLPSVLFTAGSLCALAIFVSAQTTESVQRTPSGRVRSWAPLGLAMLFASRALDQVRPGALATTLWVLSLALIGVVAIATALLWWQARARGAVADREKVG